MTQKEVDRYAAELQRHGVESVEREVRWLSELINAERSSEPGADHAAGPPTDGRQATTAADPAPVHPPEVSGQK
jgi:hypothetical protein